MSVELLGPSAPISSGLPQRAGRGPRGWLTINLLALLLASVALRTWQLGNIPGVNGDEAWSGVQAIKLLHGESIDWRTPSGNPINLFFFLPLVGLLAVLPPTFWLLRSVSLASGLLALVVNYALCRRTFDARTAVISTWLLALQPINIAYSRFAWDTSQTLLATLFVLYLPLLHYRRGAKVTALPVAGLVAYSAAIMVHPTNLLAAPLVVVPALYARRREVVECLNNFAVAARPATLIVLLAASLALAYGGWYALVHGERMHGLGELPLFAQYYLQLFSGSTVYEFISGASRGAPGAPWYAAISPASDLALGCLIVWASWGLLRRLAHRPSDADASLVLGWFAMLVGFFLVAGPRALAPHFERYGLSLIAPGMLLVARGLAWWTEPWQRQRRLASLTLLTAAWLWAAAFYAGYFEFIRETGGRSHETFRTAAIEPRVQALEVIAGERGADNMSTIVCRQWWNYWPLAYLAANQPTLRVLTQEQWEAENSTKSMAASTWFVEYAGSAAEQAVISRYSERGIKLRRELIYDYANRPLLSILALPAKISKNN